MRFAIITHVNHFQSQNQYWAYAPYVREMNVWLKHVDQVIIVAPCEKSEKTVLDIPYQHDSINFLKVKAFDIKTLKAKISTFFALPKIFIQVYRAMQQADHIHLRCPGNLGLIGCLVQILFPNKKKSAKYAGNWDENAKQPLSYKFQRWLLSQTFLTRNMQVLVYGEWPNQSKNIKPFFTATYHQSEIKTSHKSFDNTQIKCLFVGTLSNGKRPFYALKLVEQLKKNGINITLEFFGEGQEKMALENYIKQNKLDDFVFLKGNQDREATKIAYENSHFLILPSKSEGWPKVVAEAMFWGCIPIATPVSCVPMMIDFGHRGLALTLDLQKDVHQMRSLIEDKNKCDLMATQAKKWSQQFTMDKFEDEIRKVLIT